MLVAQLFYVRMQPLWLWDQAGAEAGAEACDHGSQAEHGGAVKV